MKSFRYAFLFILCFPFLGVSQSLNIPLIEVSESHVIYAPVDEIHFTIILQHHAQEIDAARNKNRKVAHTVFDILKKAGIKDRFIQTKRMRISRNYIRNRHPIEYDGFLAYQQIYVCLKDIDSYDAIVDQLLVLDVHAVNGPDFKSSEYENLAKKAKLEALKKARVSAEEMAAALGQSIGKAKLIHSNTRNNFSNSAYSSQPAQQNNQSGSTSFELGEIEIRSYVTVSFELLE